MVNDHLTLTDYDDDKDKHDSAEKADAPPSEPMPINPRHLAGLIAVIVAGGIPQALVGVLQTDAQFVQGALLYMGVPLGMACVLLATRRGPLRSHWRLLGGLLWVVLACLGFVDNTLLYLGILGLPLCQIDMMSTPQSGPVRKRWLLFCWLVWTFLFSRALAVDDILSLGWPLGVMGALLASQSRSLRRRWLPSDGLVWALFCSLSVVIGFYIVPGLLWLLSAPQPGWILLLPLVIFEPDTAPDNIFLAQQIGATVWAVFGVSSAVGFLVATGTVFGKSAGRRARSQHRSSEK